MKQARTCFAAGQTRNTSLKRPNHIAQPDPLRRAVLARLGVHGTFSQPRPSRPTVAVRLALTLGLTNTTLVTNRTFRHPSVPTMDLALQGLFLRLSRAYRRKRML